MCKQRIFFSALRADGLGESVFGWVKLLYTLISSSVIVNGYISEPFSVTRSLRQGCDICPLIYFLS